MGQHTLRVSIQENDTAVEVTLEGRLAGAWVAELERAWNEVAPSLRKKQVRLDLRNLTYADLSGKQVLRTIFKQTSAEIITSSQWSQYLAEEVRNTEQGRARGEA